MKIIEGNFSAKGKSFAIVVARFNEFISQRLLEGAVDCLSRHGADKNKITVVWVPGSFEVPMVANKLAHSKKFHSIICLGTLIRGETPHFDFIAAEATKGIADVTRSSGVPASYGIITADTIEQGIARSGSKAGNKGWDAALASIEMADLFSKLSRSRK